MSRVIAIRQGQPRALVLAGLRGAPGSGGGPGSGVSSFNGRLGVVTLAGADVTTALGYTPANNASLAGVAFSGAYSDLSGLPLLSAVALSGSYTDLTEKPFIPSTPGDIGAATAAQGAKADAAVQPAELASGLAGKVDKITGYGLSQENFTPAEKIKLAGLDGNHFKGLFASLGALQAAFPSAEAGDYADVDAGVGSATVRYLWDVSDTEWVAAGSGTPLTAADIKVLYESNPDTNVFSDAEESKLSGIEAGAQVNHAAASQAEAEAGGSTALRSWTAQRVWQAIAAWWAASAMKTKLDGIAAGATANATNAELRDRATHTGDQAISTITGLQTALDKATFAPVVTDSTTARTAVLGDAGSYLRFTNGAATAFTIPPQSSVAWPDGAEIHVRRAANANLTLTAGAGVTLTAPAGGTLVQTNAMSVTLKRVAVDVWEVIGQTVAA